MTSLLKGVPYVLGALSGVFLGLTLLVMLPTKAKAQSSAGCTMDCPQPCLSGAGCKCPRSVCTS